MPKITRFAPEGWTKAQKPNSNLPWTVPSLWGFQTRQLLPAEIEMFKTALMVTSPASTPKGDFDLAGGMIGDICYRNAERYLKLPIPTRS